ncbi:histidine phosphatase family protein [Synechococcus sp. Tobar12-5m-g]|uniref:histidine phosphatase family protein n=1 Tax=unclassified Synechococcus TaxID=2626047 RepID=UPI0037D9BFCC|nr:histidine phosphatase family protein [Synechococcus sp. Tobar12-5m-g]MCP9874777.1 histidine phosphatase family protein [Synechococcus sp. Cruz CV-v-12]
MTIHALSAGDVVVIRHGETAWRLSGEHTGTSDISLTANGERVAHALAPCLSGSALRSGALQSDAAGMAHLSTGRSGDRMDR